MNEFHRPVMLNECLEGLDIKPEGIYLDLTFGGGGHSREILTHLSQKGCLYAFDQDEDAAQNALNIEQSNFHLIEANFRFFQRYLKLYGVRQVDGILADLGISSYQIDTPSRGFSTRFEGPLDMRMNAKIEKTARQVLHEYPEEALHKILGIYGEVKNARTLAQAIVRARSNQTLETVDDFKNLLQKYAPPRKEFKYFAQVFQAIRIEVNDEMAALEEMLQQTTEVLRPGGRLVVLSYHSLEDRLVKTFIQKGKFQGEIEKDFYGNTLGIKFKPISRKPIVASQEEIAINNRARSAKLRIAERLAD
ncbi:MAG: 16S rRNA (cytosine(1402)-N(4))-methyltransferase RsmH [Microscillaceae bacterium]|nr:16S rRNA (cytosine(1402)-N(4))-methyltransferase RsmH [Microscillaceae bacterium]